MSLAIANLSWGHPLPGGGWRQLFDGFNLSQTKLLVRF